MSHFRNFCLGACRELLGMTGAQDKMAKTRKGKKGNQRTPSSELQAAKLCEHTTYWLLTMLCPFKVHSFAADRTMQRPEIKKRVDTGKQHDGNNSPFTSSKLACQLWIPAPDGQGQVFGILGASICEDYIANLSRTAILEVDVTRLTNLATTRHQIKSHP